MMLSKITTKVRNWFDSDYKVRKLFVSVHYHVFRHRVWKKMRSLGTQEVFTEIYRNNLWNNEESLSGGGSTISRTSKIRSQLPALFREYGIRSVCDAGCGDFNWMNHVDLSNIEYLGVDIVGEMIRTNNEKYRRDKRSFAEADIIRDVLPTVDLILCRECLFHLPFSDIHSAIVNFKKSGSKYLLATHHPSLIKNVDIVTGGCREINFQEPPLNFPPPIKMLDENLSEKSLVLWRLEDIDPQTL